MYSVIIVKHTYRAYFFVENFCFTMCIEKMKNSLFFFFSQMKSPGITTSLNGKNKTLYMQTVKSIEEKTRQNLKKTINGKYVHYKKSKKNLVSEERRFYILIICVFMKGENKIIQDDHHYSKLNFIPKKTVSRFICRYFHHNMSSYIMISS